MGDARDVAPRWLRSRLVISTGDTPRDLTSLVVPGFGALEATGDVFEPFRLVDADGVVVAAAAAFIAELAACGRPAATQRSYGMDLLRWFRFLWALGIGWDQATRAEARDFCRWLQVANKPARTHWRYLGRAPTRSERMGPPVPNPVTGKSGPGERFAAATVAHCESVLRGFYDFHLEAGTRADGEPVPAGRLSTSGRGIAARWIADCRAQRPVSADGGVSGRRGASQMRGSMSCSRGSARIGIGRWWRSGCRPGRGRRSCSAPRSPMSIRVSS